MRLVVLLAAWTLSAASAAPQGVDIDATTPEGQLLQQIGTEADPAQKALLLEQFVQQYSGHAAIPWVLGQLPPTYAALKQSEKSLEWCEKMIEKTPANAAGAHSCLKTAEAQNDPALVEKFALLTHGAAGKAAAAPKPAQTDGEEWKQAVDYAKQVGQYSEWSLYNAGLQAQDPAAKVALYEALAEANPQSEHLAPLAAQAFLAYRQTGDNEKALALVDQAVARNQANEDMLLVAVDYYFNEKKDAEKTFEYSQKLNSYLESASPPTGISPEDWEKKKTAAQGRAYWMMGVTRSNQKKYGEADKLLRQALPNVRDEAFLRAGALFHLGLANYQMGAASGDTKQLVAARDFFKECAGLSGPFQAQAKQNLAAIQSQYRFR